MSKQESWRGKVGKMDETEIKEFLAPGRILRIACLKEDGSPYIVPIWYEWDGETFWVIPRQKSAWAQYLEHNQACALTVDEDQAPYRKVIVEGQAEMVEEPNVGGQWVDIATRMSVRYLGENGPKYLEATLNEPRWLFRINIKTMTTWKGVAWAKRYEAS